VDSTNAVTPQVAEENRSRVSQRIRELTNAYKSPAEVSARVLIGNSDKRAKYDDDNYTAIQSQRARRLSLLAFVQDSVHLRYLMPENRRRVPDFLTTVTNNLGIL